MITESPVLNKTYELLGGLYVCEAEIVQTGFIDDLKNDPDMAYQYKMWRFENFDTSEMLILRSRAFNILKGFTYDKSKTDRGRLVAVERRTDLKIFDEPWIVTESPPNDIGRYTIKTRGGDSGEVMEITEESFRYLAYINKHFKVHY